MTRLQDDPRRRCLKTEEWPAADRMAWTAALTPGDLLHDAGAAGGWAADTIKKQRKGYGRFLGFLVWSGRLDAAKSPADRITPENVRAYLAELEDTVAPMTILGRVAELHAVALAMVPDGDWRWLTELLNRLHARRPRGRDKRSRLMPAHKILGWGLDRLRAVEADGPAGLDKAVRYRDALMISLLVLIPLRRGNLAAIELGRHLRQTRQGWYLEFEAAEMKAREPYEASWPAVLDEPLMRYLSIFRPLLDQGAASRRLWLSANGRPMSAMRAYHRITRVTRAAFGRPLNPHLFRDIAGTDNAEADPESSLATARLLGHRSLSTARRYYDHSMGKAAYRQYQAIMRRRLRQLTTTFADEAGSDDATDPDSSDPE